MQNWMKHVITFYTKHMNFRTVAYLIFILAVAFVLRSYKMTDVPPSLNWDEVSIGYNAYSILKTGRDEWGKFLPLHFKAYGEYKLPAQIYASIPGIAIFGLNDFGVRITPIMYGTLTVFLVFFLARKLFKNDYIGLLSALFLTISPWHIQLTRASFESSFSVFWIVMGIWFLIKGFEKPKWWIISIIPFAVSVYTYNSTRVFTPLFLAITFLIFRKDFLKHKREAIITGLLFFATLLPLIPFITSGEVRARYRLVSITDDPGLVPRISENRNLSKLPGSLPRLIHNRVTYISYYFVRNYLAHFTPQFLFISGAPHKQHHVQGLGELYATQAPFILLGLYFLFKRKNQFSWLIISWLLLAFIPVSVTNDSIPNALRTVIANPPYQILTAFGFCELYALLKNRKLRIGMVAIASALILFEVIRYLNIFYTVYPKKYSRDWQYGYEHVVSFIKQNYANYDEIVFSRTYGEPHMFTLFYLNWDPAKYQNDPNLVRYMAYNWVWVLRFDKFYFPDLGDTGTHYQDIVKANKNKKILFIGKQGDFPDSLPRLMTVDFLNGDRVFEIVETR